MLGSQHIVELNPNSARNRLKMRLDELASVVGPGVMALSGD